MKQKDIIPGLAGGAASFAFLILLDLLRDIPITSLHALYLLLCMVHALVASVFYSTFLANADGHPLAKGTVFGLFCGILIVRPVMLYGLSALNMNLGVFNMFENVMAYTLMGITIAMTGQALDQRQAGAVS